MSKRIADIAVWGHGPPPYGGMTIHISRLLPKLSEAGISYQSYNFSNRAYKNEHVINYSGIFTIVWFIRLFFAKTEKIHYVLSVRASIRFLSVLAGILRRKKIILRIGGASLEKGISNKSIISRIFTRFAIKHAAVVIGVNRNICQQAVSSGANPDTVRHIPGFIPPSMNGVYIPEKIRSFYKNKFPKLLITGKLYDSSVDDIYGINETINVVELLHQEYPDVGLMVFLQNNRKKNEVLVQQFIEEISARKLHNSIMIYNGELELWPIMTECDIFLRPTLSDGDANSVREALYLGVPVVASDIVERPETVLTYRTGDVGAMYSQIKSVTEKLHSYQSKVQSITMVDNSYAIISVIKDLLHNNSK